MKLNTVAVEAFGVSFSVRLTENGVHTESDEIHVSEPFDLEITNLASSSHVHVSVKGEASQYVSLTADNVYVEDDEVLEVVIGPTPGEVEGTLDIVVDYGAHEDSVELVAESKDAGPEAGEVAVDESLAQPMRPAEATADDDIPRVDILVGIVLGIAAAFSLLAALLFEGFGTIGVVLASFAIFGIAFVWFMSRSSMPRPKD